MTTDLLLVAVITLASVLLFASGRLPLDLVALLVLVSLAATGLVTPEEAVSGFSNPATVTVLAMLILSGGLTHTGAMGTVGRLIARFAAGRGDWGLLLGLMVTAVTLSAFINNTAVVAVLLPVAVKLANDHGVSPSKLLIPLSFASMFGGTSTLIGTSTNILVSTLATRHGLPAFSMFEFARLGVVMSLVGVAYMLLAGRWVLPARRGRQLIENYGVREYLTEVVVGGDSGLVGRSLADAGFAEKYGVEVLEILRGEQRLWWGDREVIQPGDTLLLRGPVPALLALKEVPGLGLRPELKLGDEDLTSDEVRLVEVVVSPTSRLRGRTPRQVFFRQRYNMTLLAVQRQGHTLRERLADLRLSVGDALLLQGRRGYIQELAEDPDLLLLGEVEPRGVRYGKVRYAVAIMAGVVALPSLGLAPILLTAVAGVAALVLTGCLKMQEAYEAVDWTVIFLLAGVIPLGIALERTGAARLLADGAVAGVGWLGPVAVLSAFYLLASLLTSLMSNNATAILLTPIAIAAASQLGVEPRTFLVAIAFAASASFMTPVGYQTNALVYGPGGYRYTDYLKAGAPLNLVFWVLATLLIPVLWPLR